MSIKGQCLRRYSALNQAAGDIVIHSCVPLHLKAVPAAILSCSRRISSSISARDLRPARLRSLGACAARMASGVARTSGVSCCRVSASVRIALLSARCRVCAWVKAWAAAKATIPLGLSFSGFCLKRRHSCRRKASFWASDIVTVPCPRVNLYLGRELEGSGVG